MKRSKRLQRLVDIQRKKEKVAENDLALVLAEKHKTRESIETTISSLGDFSPINLVMTGHYSKRLLSLEKKIGQLDKHCNILQINKQTESVKADRMADKVKQAKIIEAREDEGEELHDLIDKISSLG